MTKKKKLNPRAVLGRKILDAADKFEAATGEDDHATWLFRDWAASISDPDAPERVFLLEVADALEEARDVERAALLEYAQNRPFTLREARARVRQILRLREKLETRAYTVPAETVGKVDPLPEDWWPTTLQVTWWLTPAYKIVTFLNRTQLALADVVGPCSRCLGAGILPEENDDFCPDCLAAGKCGECGTEVGDSLMNQPCPKCGWVWVGLD